MKASGFVAQAIARAGQEATVAPRAEFYATARRRTGGVCSSYSDITS